MYTHGIIDGKTHAKILLSKLSTEVAQFKHQYQIVPKLVVIIVGSDPASQIYVRNKATNAKAIGMISEIIALDESISEKKLLKIISGLNKDNDVHGIIVQLPLPKQINTLNIISAISPSKDVDGFHPINVGKLHTNDQSGLFPCTPLGIIHLLKHYLNDLTGKHVAIIGRSNIVGQPVAAMLLQENCTITICHSHTKDLAAITKQADIVITAIGKPNFLSAEYFKAHSTIIDVGINRIETYGKTRLVGDVDFANVVSKVAFITPVPGGVGPMTIAFLLSNTLKAAMMKLGIIKL
jgi:methylenetetrahydrofolate dehydrogenase (NADP+)/methenyltetrahydrofolate cyclohydrolase